MAERGGTVTGAFEYEGSGTDPDWLRQAALLAEPHGATLLAESADRFIRRDGYHSERWPKARAEEYELEELRFYTLGCALMTVLHPDAELAEVRGWQSRRGQAAKDNRGGRRKVLEPGYKKERRLALLGRVLGLHQKKYTQRQIAEEVDVPISTIHDWISKHC